MNTKHKTKAFLVWSVIISVLFVFLLTITLVLTQNKFLYNTINSVIGGEQRYLKSGDPSEYQYFRADYADKKEALAAANALNERICGEGITLLKNEDDALPLPAGQKITVFGRNSVQIALGGSGSNQGKVASPVTDVAAALEKAGFVCNPVLRNYYQKEYKGPLPFEVSMGSILTGYPVCEAPLPYPQTVTDSYGQYGDAAVVVVTRIGGEGFDLPRTMFWDGSGYKNWDAAAKTPVPGARSADDHYLQLDANETAMLKEACANFAKVIVVVNSASPLELGFLDDPAHYAYSPKIKAALWIGHPGGNGLDALGKVLSGAVNPSGRTVDTYARNFKDDPSWQNFGNYLAGDGNRYEIVNDKGKREAKNAFFVEYREGIYVGYRYYETRAYEETAADPQSAWYEENVVYPFGYGLSYSDFTWTVDEPTTDGVLTAETTVTVDVTVRNNGPYKGRDVIQLYYTAPYTGGVEKAHVVLGDFVKTDELAPDEEKTYTLTLPARDMASYNYLKNNADGTKGGYELEAGEYGISVRRDAHTPVATLTYNAAETIPVKRTADDGADAVNLFDDVSGHIGEYLSRKDNFANLGTLAGASEAEHRLVTQDFIASLTYRPDDKTTDPWYAETAPPQQKHELSYNDTEVRLYDLIDKPYDDPLWTTLLDQLTVEQMTALVATGNYRTLAIENIGKPLTIDSDGPMGFASYMGDGVVYDTCYYACEAVLGATWNEALAREFGVMVGNEGLIGNEKGDGRTYSGWYAPAMNIHRSQFGGRNFEYYSEDGLLSGRMATAVVRGANEKGVYTFAKHFALNEQETNRDTTGLITWANEQAMRELYFKPFEMCVTEGGTTAIMSSFNRIGSTWAGGDYRLLTLLLRDEWGFEGTVITDFNLKPYMNVDQMLRAGGDLNLSPDKGPSSAVTATDISVIRSAAKNILYTVAQSNALNGNGKNVVWGYALPWWVVWLIVASCGIFALGGALWAVVIVRKRKTLKQKL